MTKFGKDGSEALNGKQLFPNTGNVLQNSNAEAAQIMSVNHANYGCLQTRKKNHIILHD